MLVRKLVRASLVVMLGAALIACRGDKKDDTPSSTPAPEPTASRDASPEATESDPVDDDDDSSSTSDDLRSFHYVVTINMQVEGGGDGGEDGIRGTIEGNYVGPDAHAFTQEYGFGGLTISESYVIIGEDAWSKEGKGAWQTTTADDPEVADATDLTSADPDFFAFDDGFVDDITFLKGEDDVKNGIDTSRIEIDADELRRLGSIFDGGDIFAGTDAEGIEDLAMRVWLTRDETRLVALDIDAAFGADSAEGFPFEVPPGGRLILKLTVDLSRIDDETISIEPPI